MDKLTIAQTRKELGENQEVFGQRFGVDQSTICRWEAKGPPKRGAARIAVEKVLEGLQGATQATPATRAA